VSATSELQDHRAMQISKERVWRIGLFVRHWNTPFHTCHISFHVSYLSYSMTGHGQHVQIPISQQPQLLQNCEYLEHEHK